MKSKAKDRKPVIAMVWDKLSDPILEELSFVSRQSAKDIAKSDAPRVSTAHDKYVTDNWVTYYLVTNCWLHMANDISERGRLELHEAVLRQGLIATIAECDGVSNAFIESYALDEGELRSDIPTYLVHLLSSCRNDKEALEILRFPKRFSPNGADLVRDESIQSLIATNNRCKGVNRNGFEGWASYKPSYQRTFPSRYWIERLKDQLAEMLDGYYSSSTDGLFSTGVAADASRPLGEKLQQYGLWRCSLYDDPLYPISTGAVVKLWEGSPFHDKLFCAKVQAVPKSYKAARVIAEEHAYRQFHMQAIRKGIERCLARNGFQDYLDLHSQIRNQQYAEIGSRVGCYATIDLSSASDSVARSLAYEVLPGRLVSDVDTYLPRTFQVNGVQRTMHMFCTSGSAVTFPVESVVFLALALVIRDVVSALTQEVYLPPVVFGDDIVIDVMLYDTMAEVLEQLGFVVNTAKSFGPGTAYRESCGCEYVCGYDLKSVYWPRATFTWSGASLASTIGQICALQHKLYGTYGAQKFLTTFVRKLEPRMTSHAPGTECPDLWEGIPTFLSRSAPVAGSGAGSPHAMREGHLTLKTRYNAPGHIMGDTGLSSQSLVEMWRYTQFLINGPTYDSDLERLLGVSSKGTPVWHDCVDGHTFWGYVTE